MQLGYFKKTTVRTIFIKSDFFFQGGLNKDLEGKTVLKGKGTRILCIRSMLCGQKEPEVQWSSWTFGSGLDKSGSLILTS